MRSASQLRGPAFEDLTARARIRDVALLHFAERGVEGATIRGIAADAGVSPGLVQHHYGSKEELRQACDAYVVDLVRRQAGQTLDERQLGDPAIVAAAYQTGALVMRYLARALVEDSPAAASLFDEMVALTQEYLATTGQFADDPTAARAHAAVFTAMKLGVSVFHDHLARVLSVDGPAVALYPAISRAMLDIVSPTFFSPERAVAARAGLEGYEQMLGGLSAAPIANRGARQ